jgi:hypothetical protein
VGQQKSCLDEKTHSDTVAAENCIPPGKLTGAFERYRQVVAEQRVADMLRGQAAFSRAGPLSPWVVIWLMIFQRLDANGSLSAAVRHLLTGPARAFALQREGAAALLLSANTSAYSQARCKLPLAVAERVSQLLFESLQEQPKILPGLDRPVFLLDGSTILLAHHSALAKTYPPQRNQHGASHWPTMRVLVAHDMVSGLAAPPCWGPVNGLGAVSEQGLAKDIMGRLPADCGIVGDRNFGVLSMAWHATQGNRPCLFRLTEARAKKLNGGLIAPSAKVDKAIRWSPSREDLRSNPEIPTTASVAGRLLAFRVCDANDKLQKLYFFTTFTLPPEQILRVYGYRWNIETDLRSLKREVRLHMLDVRTPDMAAKELVLSVAAYNLTRAAMNAAGSALGLDPRQFSFSRAQDTLNAYLPLFANATSDQQRRQLMQEMLRVFSQSKLPRHRNRPSYPREIWPRPCSFPKRKVAYKRVTPNQKKEVA